MSDFVMPLMLGLDISSLTMSLVNIASPRGDEAALADSVEAALRPLAQLDVARLGDTVVARTDNGHAERVAVVGHLGTAPSDREPLAYVEMGKLYGPGACDAKGALAVALRVAADGGFNRDVTFIFGEPADPASVLAGAGFALLAAPTGAAVGGAALDHPQAVRLRALTDVDPLPAAPDAGALGRLDIPAVAFGPGDPTVAGTPDEFVPTAQLSQCEFVLRQWLTT